MRRRGFLALLPLPWLGKLLPVQASVKEQAAKLLQWMLREKLGDNRIIVTPKPDGSNTFVWRQPEFVTMWSEDMEPDIIVDDEGHRNRIVTYE